MLKNMIMAMAAMTAALLISQADIRPAAALSFGSAPPQVSFRSTADIELVGRRGYGKRYYYRGRGARFVYRNWRYDRSYRYRHHGRYYYRGYPRYRYKYPYPYYYYGYGYPWWGYSGATIALGYSGYEGYGGYYGDDDDRNYDAHVVWCLKRYRSYNPRTNTFRGYDGRKHRCRSPY